MRLTYTDGKRGKSKSEVKLSVDTFMGALVFHVWEGGKITHTFYANQEFTQASEKYAGLVLGYQKWRKGETAPASPPAGGLADPDTVNNFLDNVMPTLTD